jgi:hypothetical protein
MMQSLPAEATERVRRIEALLAEAEPIIARGGATDEATFSLRETRTRYLPDTINAYLDVPPSLRAQPDAGGKTPDERLLAQLDHLERAAAQRLRELAARSTDTVAANERFLTERFGDAAALPPSDVVATGNAPPATLVHAFFDQIAREAHGANGSLVVVAAERFTAIVPQLVTVKRGAFGMGPVEAFSIDVPVRDFVLRYALTARRGGIDASATKVVRGVALRTEIVDLDEWLRGLYEDLGAYVERDRRTRDTLTRFLEQ